MRLHQLREFLDATLAAGVDPDTIVCIHDADANELVEVTDADLMDGPYREDPSPKCPAFLIRSGRVLLLTSEAVDYGQFIEHHNREHLPVDAPEKTWPAGWGK
ncbi:hypothetical protein BXL72_21975 [Salmonella enterica subsp. enterica serovar Enteritidis]|nr:hypothetical protein [Salmonella enterica subsp. enterica serovar Enteritidis]